MLVDYFVYIRIFLYFVLACLMQACGSSRWYSIEQEPATPHAFIHQTVFVLEDYIRVTSIREIDGKVVDKNKNNKITISATKHQIKIYCDETRGAYDSNSLSGQARILEFEAKMQRVYRVYCYPYTHWWIEDSENSEVVAGEKPNMQIEI